MPFPSPQVLAERRAALRAVSVAGGLIWLNRIGEAQRFMHGFEASHPGSQGYFRAQQITCDLAEQRYLEAFRQAAGQLRLEAGQVYASELPLQVSLASAELGQVYPGQLDYAQCRLVKLYRDQHFSSPEIRELGNSRDANVAITSCLALGMRYGASAPPYFELALKLDPKNRMAAHELLRIYEGQGRYKDLRRVALAMSERLGPGDGRAFYLRELQVFRDAADKPQPDPYAIKMPWDKVDTGKP